MPAPLPVSDSSLSPQSSAGRAWLAGMGVFLAMVGLLFTWVLWRAYSRAEETRAWIETPCTIVGSSVRAERPTPGSNITFWPDVRYVYQFNGQTLTGRRIKRVDGRSTHEERVRATLTAFPAGLKTVCHVNPAAPEEAVLVHGTRAALYSIWFPLLFVVGGLGMTWNALRWKPIARRS